MPDEWFRSAYSEIYTEIYRHRDRTEAENFTAVIVKYCALPPGGIVLDVACGAGRYAIGFARLGYRVVGIDLSQALLDRAAASARQSFGIDGPANLLFARADMRSLPFSSDITRADLVLNLFTSFGYFASEEENRVALSGMSGALKPGGTLVLDFLNREHVVANLVPEDEQEREGMKIRQQRQIVGGDEDLRIEKRIAIEYADDRREEYLESVRLYSREELERMLQLAGLESRAWWGDYSANPYGSSSPRCVAIARKPQ